MSCADYLRINESVWLKELARNGTAESFEIQKGYNYISSNQLGLTSVNQGMFPVFQVINGSLSFVVTLSANNSTDYYAAFDPTACSYTNIRSLGFEIASTLKLHLVYTSDPPIKLNFTSSYSSFGEFIVSATVIFNQLKTTNLTTFVRVQNIANELIILGRFTKFSQLE